MSTYAKLLLFGEHIVIQGASALAYPWKAYRGYWTQEKGSTGEVGKKPPSLRPWLTYLQNLQHEAPEDLPLDLDRMERDLDQGFFFFSDIPNGYGAGSSGALCAATYKRYARTTTYPPLLELKKSLGRMESFFHGASSGTDPLICLLEKAILIRGGDIRTVSLDLDRLPSPYRLFVLNTGLARETGPWVKYFLEQSDVPAFREKMQQILIPASDGAIAALLEYRAGDLYRYMHQISVFHYENLRAMIPAPLHTLWAEGLDDASGFKLKICGAGGGGFMLGMARSEQALEQLGRHFPIQVI